MENTLVILGHPSLERSIANSAIVRELEKSIPNVEIRNIAKLYNNFQIDVDNEQEALKKADTIILQFPVQWYNVPGILKHWLDMVFSLGFAHGPDGDKLKGKKLLVSFTTGVPFEVYDKNSKDEFRIENLDKWFKQVASYSQMNYLGAIYECGMMAMNGQTKEQVEEKALRQAGNVKKLILN